LRSIIQYTRVHVFISIHPLLSEAKGGESKGGVVNCLLLKSLQLLANFVLRHCRYVTSCLRPVTWQAATQSSLFTVGMEVKTAAQCGKTCVQTDIGAQT